MKAQFEELLKQKNLAISQLSKNAQSDISEFEKAASGLFELESEKESADYDESQVAILKGYLDKLDQKICKYLNNYEKYQGLAKKMQDANNKKRATKSVVDAGSVTPKSTPDAKEVFEGLVTMSTGGQTTPPANEPPLEAPEKKKSSTLGWIVGGILGIGLLAAGIQYNNGGFPFKRR